MRITTHILMGIVPLCVAIALVLGYTSLAGQHRQVEEDLHDEAFALASSIAQFLSLQDFQELASKGERAEAYGAIRTILLHGQVSCVIGLASDGRPELFRFCVDEDQRAFFKVKTPPDLRDRLVAGSGNVHVGDSQAHGEVGATMCAFGGIRAADGVLAGIVAIAVLTRDDDLSHARAFRNKLVFLVAWAILSSLIVGTYLARVLRRPIRAMIASAARVADGDYEQHESGGRIRELDDLASTFNTMTSLLGDLIEKSRRTLAEEEQFRSARDAALLLREMRWSPRATAIHGIEVITCCGSSSGSGDLVFAADLGSLGVALLARVRKGAGDNELQADLRAAAAQDWLLEMAARQTAGLAEVVEEAADLFDLELAELATWDASDRPVRRVSWQSGARAEERPDLLEENALVIAAAPAPVAARVHVLVQVFAAKSAPELLAEIEGEVREVAAASFLVLRRQASEPVSAAGP
ncbi:MAG: HAMP domain-containing protein [Candidatus Schekmanbacteria bacterium]|nr:HAMP domain-containing protein [Candidatus Schekmanbacteria bacterium]